jgi:hypothetical protein
MISARRTSLIVVAPPQITSNDRRVQVGDHDLDYESATSTQASDLLKVGRVGFEPTT